jgi:hypothetical protein
MHAPGGALPPNPVLPLYAPTDLHGEDAVVAVYIEQPKLQREHILACQQGADFLFGIAPGSEVKLVRIPPGLPSLRVRAANPDPEPNHSPYLTIWLILG